VTGNRYRDLVGSTRGRNGAHGFRRTNPLSYFPVAGGLTRRNFSQRLPNTLLKSRAAHIEREIEADPGLFDNANDIGDYLFEIKISAKQICPWKSVLKITDKFFRIIAEKDGTNTLLTPRHQDGAKRTLADSKLDVHIKAAVPECGGRHAKHLI
jgi:hypothetical protein